MQSDTARQTEFSRSKLGHERDRKPLDHFKSACHQAQEVLQDPFAFLHLYGLMQRRRFESAQKVESQWFAL